ncbi:MAG: T9SS type A sorting domain-containing protein, partial [Actinobacteria bacterium]|nr:T9SS type A sorting domain-containing protein [Actinomycetota bacterium]
GGSVQVDNSRQWKTHTFHLANTYFANRENGGSDFRIYTPGVLFVHRVTVLNTEPTGVRERKKEILKKTPTGFGLLQNYPNPFNPTTKISFEIPQEGRVTLSIYNLQGQLVTTLVHAKLSAGVHQVSYDANGLTSGIYFARLDADGKNSDTIKMSLLK